MRFKSLDSEATGLDLHHGCRPFAFSLCSDDGNIDFYQWEVDPFTRQPQYTSADILELRTDIFNPDVQLVMHNTKFDIRALLVAKVTKRIKALMAKTDDTLIMSHVLDSFESHKLNDLAEKYCGIPTDDEKELRDAATAARRIGKKLKFDLARDHHPHAPGMKISQKHPAWKSDMWVPRAVAIHEGYAEDHPWMNVLETYSVRDAVRTINYFLLAREVIKEEGLQSVYEFRLKMIPVTWDMEQNGLPIKPKAFQREKESYAERQIKYEGRAIKIADRDDLNLKSPKQLSEVIFNQFKLKAVKYSKKTEEPSTAAECLLEMLSVEKAGDLLPIYDTLSRQHKFIANLLFFRKCGKSLDYLTSYERIIKNGFIHPSYNITGTCTTRLSSSNPNAQNISKADGFNLRAVFGPRPHEEWFAIDFDNIELRIFAYESGDEQLIEAFEEGASFHMVIAKVLWPQYVDDPDFKKTDRYRWVKNGNFSLIYGSGEENSDRTYHQEGAYRRIRNMLPSIDVFMSDIMDQVREQGYITTRGGYRLYCPKDIAYAAVNYFIQGSAGWVLQQAMLNCYRYLNKNHKSQLSNGKMIASIHDELIFSYPKEQATDKEASNLCKRMERAGMDICGYPLTVSVDRITHKSSWSNGEGISI